MCVCGGGGEGGWVYGGGGEAGVGMHVYTLYT